MFQLFNQIVFRYSNKCSNEITDEQKKNTEVEKCHKAELDTTR